MVLHKLSNKLHVDPGCVGESGGDREWVVEVARGVSCEWGWHACINGVEWTLYVGSG